MTSQNPREVCCWTNCDNEAGSGTWTQIDVPQVGSSPMQATLPVCEEHWFGNWDHERRRLTEENGALLDILVALLDRASAKLPPRQERASNMSAYGVRQMILDGLAAAGLPSDEEADRG